MSTFQYYTVANHGFAVKLREALPPECYAPFASASCDTLFTLEEVTTLPALSLTAVALPPAQDYDAAHIALYTAQWNNGNGFLFELAPHVDTAISAQLLVNRDNGEGWIVVNDEQERRFAVDSSLMLLYALFSANRQTLLMHASTVVKSGIGYLFLGISGTGKSTHSRLWLETLDEVTLLNDDNPVVHIGDDGVARVYGTPWSGKTPCYLNHSAPVGAIVDLEQAPCNEIVRLSAPEAYAAILSSSSGMKCDSATADGLHNTLAALLTQVGCWHLRCLPDHAAAQLCHSTVGVTAPLAGQPIEISNAILLSAVADMLREGKQVTLATKGYSMLPFIRGNVDSVRLQRHKNYSVGDVVLAEVLPKHYVLHRIIGIAGDAVTLSGDGNLQGTEHCRTENIVGRAEAIVGPKGRERKVATAQLWRRLPYWVRRIVLAVLHRTEWLWGNKN